MIGNDIIDLGTARVESDWQRPRFLKKLFTVEERDYIQQADDPFRMVWLLWSMKESAYKAYLQNIPNRFFNPKRITCKLFDETCGSVCIGSLKFYTTTEITGNRIHTIAKTHQNFTSINEVFELSANDEKCLHDLLSDALLNMLAQRYQLSKTEIEIRKNGDGVPYAHAYEAPLNSTFSLSHHGKYGAYVILN